MKINKSILVGILLLTIIFMGVASAAEEYDIASTDVVAGTGDYKLSSPVTDEIYSDGDVKSLDSSSVDVTFQNDTAVGNDVKSVKNSKEKLGASNDEYVLGDDYDYVITPQIYAELGANPEISGGNFKFEGTFRADDGFSPFMAFHDCIIEGSEAEFIDIGIIISGNCQVTGLTLTSTNYLEDSIFGYSPGAIVYVEGYDNILDGITINYAPDAVYGDAYGIYAINAYNFQLLNSNITFTGSSLEDYYEYALRVETGDDVLIRANKITANLPIINVDYTRGNPGLITDLVLNTGIRDITNLNIINNTFIANVVDRNGDYPTLDCVMIESCGYVNVTNNKFRETDFITNEGDQNYLNVLDMYYSSNVLVKGNEISVETTGGSEDAGTSYPIQLTGPYENVIIDGNDLYAHYAGPALGIYSQNFYGTTEITVQNNNIDITGLPTTNSYGLVSGIELQDNVARVYNNTITTKSITGSYEDGMNIYGISYAQSLNEDHNYDIRGNTIETEGQYTIYLLKAQDTTITDNYLLSSTGEGDDTVYIRDASGNTVVENNRGAKEEPETFYAVVTADNFFDYFDASNSYRLRDSVPEGATLDFQGSFISTSSVSYVMEINKPINMISTTKDAYINLNTIAQGMQGENPGDRFTVSYNGSGTNISDISFYNSQLWFYNTHNLTINNLTSIVDGREIGSGVGVVAFRANSSHISIKNSYFSTKDNGGHSNFVLTNANHISVDNSTIKGEGNVGNLIYYNFYNMEGFDGMFLPQIMQLVRQGKLEINDHNSITNCKIYGPETALGICYLFQDQSSGNNVLENNTIVYSGVGVNMGSNGIVKGNNITGGCGVTAGSGTQVINNNISGKVTAGGSNVIAGNRIITTENYAIELGKTKNNEIYDNYLVSAKGKGDAAVDLGTGSGNVVSNNGPVNVDISLSVEKTNFWLPSTNTVTITTDATGTIEIKVNGKTVATESVDNGQVVYTIQSSDIKVGENTVTAIYQGIEESATFNVYGLVTNETWDTYFDAGNSGRLKDSVPEGATLDFRGKFLTTDDKNFKMIINKPINIISSSEDAYVDLNTQAGSLMGENPGDCFTINYGGSGTNVSGICFHNSQMWLTNTHNVTLDNVSVVVESRQVGSGVGVTAIRSNSTNVTVKNSYFYTKDNGGSTTIALSWADYCTIENNTILVEGNVGNMIYLNTYNVDIPSGVSYNKHNIIKNNVIWGNTTAAAIRWGIVINGAENIIDNNTIHYNKGVGLAAALNGDNIAGNVFSNNKLYDTCSIGGMTPIANAIFHDNYVSGNVNVGTNCELYNNTVDGTFTIVAGCEAYGNTIGGAVTATNANVHDNTIGGTITLDGADASASGTIGNLILKSNVNVANADVTGTLTFIGSNSVVSNSTVNNVVFGESNSKKATNSKLINSNVTGTVSTSRYSTGNSLIGNNISQAVTLQGANDIIYQNSIITSGNYAVDASSTRASANNISDNYLISNGKKGNAAVTYASGKNHIVENNGPDLVIENTSDVLVGNDNNVVIKLLPSFKETDVVVKVNNNLIGNTNSPGLFTQVLSANDLTPGLNTVEVTAFGITKTTTFNVIKIGLDLTEEITLGENNSLTVTITDGTGEVTIKVNGAVIATPTLVNGIVTQIISASDIVTGENTVEVTYNGFTNSTKFNATEVSNLVTPDNFFSFFDSEGQLLDTVEFNELIFKGEFENLVDYISIYAPLTIVGDGATLKNIGFIIQETEEVTLNNLKLVADKPLGALIDVIDSYDVNLTNLDITYDGGDEMAVAINVAGDNINILNNTIFFESHVSDDNEFAVGLKLTKCTDILVDGNDITTKLPCVYCNNYDEDYYMMGSDKVNPVRIKDCRNLVFTNNNINSTTNDYSADFPTIQSIQIIGCKDSILDHNNISMIDEMTPAGMDNYLYGINFGYNTNVTFSNNNFNMSTRGGKDAAGTAYAFQGVESEVIIKGNNITSISNGPNLGIYVASMFGGDSDLIIVDNFINVTGFASSTGSWALVSGIEIQNGDAKIYNNTIYTYNVNTYDEYAYMYGISYAQWMYGDRSFDIQDNIVYTEGKYTISVIDATSLNAERNILYAHELTGDDSVNPGSCADVNIKHNLPTNIVTQDNFHDFFDEFGNLLDTVEYDELIFQGDFANLVSYITIDRALTITGDDAVLNDIAFIIAGSGVTLDNMTLVANSNLGNLIDIAVENVVISNMDINYVVDEAASAINVNPGANNVQILNNTIYFESTVDKYSADEVTTAICVNSGVSVFGDEDPIEGLVIDGNDITAVIPAFLADPYENEYYLMGLSAVNGVRINGAKNFKFTNNKLNVTTNWLYRTTPTFQALYVASSSGLIDGNNISMIDTFTPAGKDVYLYAVELIKDEELTISNNNFKLSTTGGKDEAGSAYAIIAIESNFDVVDNNITTVSNGPNLAIYFPSNMGAPCEAVISGNFINVTGLATAAHNTGLVSGIEIQTGDIEITGNTIYTYNIGEYAEGNYIYGISYAQDGVNSNVKITDNTVITEGHYAISFIKVDNAVITDNYLVSTGLKGDNAVEIKAGSGNTVENNYPKGNITADRFEDGLTINVTDKVSLNVTLTDETGKAISGATVVFLLNNTEYTNVTDAEGKAYFDLSGIAVGEYLVNYRFDGNDKYSKCDLTVNDKLTVSKISTEINVANSTVDMEVGSEIGSGAYLTPADAGNVTYTVSNYSVVKVENGKIIALGEGNATITVSFAGDDKYAAAGNKTIYVTVNPKVVPKENLTLEANANPITVGENATVVVTGFKDATGNVTVTVNGKTYTAPINGDKVAIVVSGLIENATALISYPGDAKYNNASASVDIVVNPKAKENVTIVIDAPSEATEGENVTVTVTLPRDATGSVTIGNEVVPVKGGVASAVLANLPVGNNNVSVSYSGDDKYNSIETSVAIKVNEKPVPPKENLTISASADPITVGEDAIVVVSGLKDATGNVIVTVNGKTYTVPINGDKVTVTVSGLIENATALISYSGDAKYNNASASVDIVVNPKSKENATISIDAPSEATEGENVTVTVTLPRDATGSVTIGNEVVPVKNGAANVVLTNVPAGNTIVPVSYSGDDKYNSIETSVAIKVNEKPVPPKENLTISASADPITVGEDAVIVVSGLKDASGNVTVSVNGKTYTAPIGGGTATVKISGLTDNVAATVSYAGDAKYNAASTTVDIVVNPKAKENATISIDAPEITEGESATVTVTLPRDATGSVTIGGKVVPVKDGVASAVLANLPVGNNKVPVTYSGDDKYNSIETSTVVTVKEKPVPPKENLTISASADPITVGEDAVIVVSGFKDATGNVVVSVNGKTYTASINGDKVTVVVSGLTENATALISYPGDAKYNAASTTVDIVVNPKAKENATISIDAPEITEGESASVTVTLPRDATGSVTIGGKVVPVKDGVASAVLANLPVGNNKVPVTYSGDDKYNSIETSTVVTVNEKPVPPKENLTISASADPITVGEDAVIVVSGFNDATGNVAVSVNGKTYTAPIKDGKSTITVSGLTENAAASVTYAGDDKYNAASTTVDIVVNPKAKENATMNIGVPPVTEGQNAIVNVELPKDATGNVSAVVGGKTYVAPIKDGKATITIPELAAGNYNVPVTYSGDDKYNQLTEEIKITVDEDKSDIIKAPDVTKYFNGPERFVVTVTDYQGKPLANKSVTIFINGVPYNRKTNDNGTTSIALKLGTGVYNATVTVDNKSINSVVTILSTSSGNDITKVSKNGTQYYATFRDSQGNYLKEGETVRFNINGVMYDRKISDDKGLAKLNINLEAGEYVITAINLVTGDKSSNTITVLSRITENADLIKYYRNSSQYTVKILGSDGKAVGAGESVTFNINGVLYTRQTDANGIAKLNINLHPGDYVITAEYQGSRVSNNIKVLPVLSASDISMKYRDGTKFKANLVDSQGKPYAGQFVTFNINGVFYNRMTDSNGQAKLNINLMPGEYIITSSYNSSSISNTIKISA